MDQQSKQHKPRPLLIVVGLGLCLILVSWGCFHHAAPNEWLLVVSDQGAQTKAVVGGSHFASPWERVVRFPSTLQKVSFKAQQVTREMQGIEVSGFASWVVYREEQGPLKAFRHLNGLTPEGIDSANDSLRDMAESILRAKLANLSISEVLTSRELLRDVCQKSMMEVVRGWGVWIETLEVTDVKVLSNSLFSNLQTTFREETRLAAEMSQLETQRQIGHRQLQLELKQSEQEAEIQTQKLATKHKLQHREMELKMEQANAKAELDRKRVLFKLQQDAILAQEEAKLEQQRHELELSRMQREQEVAILKMKNMLALNATQAEHQREVQEQEHELSIKQLKDRLDAEKTMTDANHRNAQLQATKEVFSSLPLHDVKLVNFGGMPGGNTTGGSEMGLLPGLWAGVQS